MKFEFRKTLGKECDMLKDIASKIEINTFYDVGYNFGGWKNFVVNTIPSCSIIYAFEPQPESKQHALSDKEITKFYPVALSDFNGTGLFTSNINDDKYGYDAHLISKDRGNQSYGHDYEVNVFRLDTLIENDGLTPPDLLKVDAQGEDYKILLGCGEYLQSTKIVHVEIFYYRLLDILKLMDDKFFIYDMSSYGFSKRFQYIDMTFINKKFWKQFNY